MIVPFKDREVYEGMRVQVYLNLHKVEDDGTKWYSLREKKTGKVVAHADNVNLKDVKFHVSEAGRDRVRKEKRKNVHAWVEGTLWHTVLTKCQRVCYNPYRDDNFKTSDGENVWSSDTAVLESNGQVTV